MDRTFGFAAIFILVSLSACHSSHQGGYWVQTYDYLPEEYYDDIEYGNEAINKGNEAAKAGDHRLAVEHFTTAIDLTIGTGIYAPDKAPVHLSRGYSYWSLGELEQALSDFDSAIRMAYSGSDVSVAAYNSRCKVRVKLGRVDEGLSDCEEALRLKPDSEETIYPTAYIHEGKGNSTRAVELYRRLLELNPGHPGAKEGLTRLGAI